MRRLFSVVKVSLLVVAFGTLLAGMASAHTVSTKEAQEPQQSQAVAHTLRAHEVGVYVWATDVFVRSCASKTCGPVDQISTTNVTDICQLQGDVVTDAGFTNNWWSYIVTPGGIRGWISNIYIRGDAVIGGVPHC